MPTDALLAACKIKTKYRNKRENQKIATTWEEAWECSKETRGSREGKKVRSVDT